MDFERLTKHDGFVYYWELIDELITGFDDFKQTESDELIVLKGIKPETHPSVKKKSSGKRLEYEDTENTRAAR